MNREEDGRSEEVQMIIREGKDYLYAERETR